MAEVTNSKDMDVAENKAATAHISLADILDPIAEMEGQKLMCTFTVSPSNIPSIPKNRTYALRKAWSTAAA